MLGAQESGCLSPEIGFRRTVKCIFGGGRTDMVKSADPLALSSAVAIRSVGTRVTRSAMASTRRTVSSTVIGMGKIGEPLSPALKLRKLIAWTQSVSGIVNVVVMAPSQSTKHSPVKRLTEDTSRIVQLR
ncbi:hypothetical protein ON010_g10008 [Phytophthora cinnamomi]|nr:hypothetical protein ON010_g10008 [Phytophthora cinnamomi]